MLSTSTETRRYATPTLVIDESQECLLDIAKSGVFTVNNEELAREVLRKRGLKECCIEDRLSVARGGPVLCYHD